MGDEERPHKLTGRSGRRRRGNEVKESVQSEDEKDEAKKKTGDDNGDFHVTFFCLIPSILTSIYLSRSILNEKKANPANRRLLGRASLARPHESFSGADPARGEQHQTHRTRRL